MTKITKGAQPRMPINTKFYNCVSVIMPIGRWDDFVTRAINSVLLQDKIIGELLLIDNSTSGPSRDQMKVILSCEKIKVIVSEHKLDAARARNIGILNSHYEFIAVLDSDDEYLKDHLYIAAKELKEKNTDFYCCAYINQNTKDVKEIRKPDKILTPESLIRQCTIGHSTIVYKKHLAFKYPEIGRRHDYAIWLQLFARGLRYSVNDKAHVIRHKTAGSLSSTNLFGLFFKHIFVTYKYSPFNFYKTSRLLIESFTLRIIQYLKKYHPLNDFFNQKK